MLKPGGQHACWLIILTAAKDKCMYQDITGEDWLADVEAREKKKKKKWISHVLVSNFRIHLLRILARVSRLS